MAALNLLKRIMLDTMRRERMPLAKPDPVSWSDDAITGSCLGHSTVFMNIFGVRLLIDPVFSSRVGPGAGPFILGPKRYISPALSANEVPDPDVILLSHAHFDHFDVRSLKRFDRSTPVITAKSTADLLRSIKFRHIHELPWETSLELTVRGLSISIQALQVKHWGARMMRDDHRGYNGYLVSREGHCVCFAGDTAYTPNFSRLNDGVRQVDLMVMPIGAYDPWIRNHCSPEQAVAMANEAGAHYFVPVHHETFKLSSEPMDEPAARIRAAFASNPERLLAVHVGETFRVPTASTVFSQSGLNTNIQTTG